MSKKGSQEVAKVRQVVLPRLMHLDLAPMLSLGLLAKRYRAHQGKLLPAWDLQTLRVFKERLQFEPRPAKRAFGGVQLEWSRVLGSHHGRVSRVYQTNTDSDLAMWEESSTQGQ